MAAAPELIPEGVTIAEALPALGQLAAVLFVLGCIYVVHGFVIALFGTIRRTVGWIPWFGHVIEAPIHTIEQKVTNTLGSAEHALDNRIGTCLHKLALLASDLEREIVGSALDLWHLAVRLDHYLTFRNFVRLIKVLLHPIRAAQAIDRALLRGTRTELHALEHSVAQGVYPRLRAEERTIERVVEPEIAALRERAKAIEDRVIRLRDWVRAHERLVVSAAFVGAVAFALRRLGLGWLRCRNVKKTGRALCGLPADLLDAVLGIALGFELLVDPEEIAQVALDVESAFEGVFERIAS